MSIFNRRADDLAVRAFSRRIGSEQVVQFGEHLFVRRIAAQQLDDSVNQCQVAHRVIDLGRGLRLSLGCFLFQSLFV